MHPEPIYQLALTQIPTIGNVLAKALIDVFGTAAAIFKASKKELIAVDGISIAKANQVRDFKDFEESINEYNFIQKNSIQLLFISDEKYPKRLLQCYDPPTLLFYKGDANLNAEKMVSVVGTRSITDYGKSITEKILEELAPHEITIISGLAYGIDTVAHRACVKNNIPTVAVVAHGLHTIYPAENAKLVRQMIEHGGGILSEFWSGTKPDKHNFPTRNRVVAGMTDATIVIETALGGGSMITAELANGYNKDVFAVPGRLTDTNSQGCLQLIKKNKAELFTQTEQFLDSMNWLPKIPKKGRVQRQLFISLTTNEQLIFDLLNKHEQLSIDDIKSNCSISPSNIASALLSLELHGILQVQPGKMYKVM